MMATGSYRWRIGASILIAVTVLGAAHGASAFSFGQTSDQFIPNAALGCNNTNCHSGGTKPTVSLTGPTSVLPGSTNIYTLTINNPATQPRGGLNVAAPGGIFSTGGSDAAQTQTLANGKTGALEITHLGPKSAVSGVTTFTFQWTAPNSFTSVTLTGWGNAVNFDHTSKGDAASVSSLVVSNGAQAPTSTPSPTATPAPPTVTATPTRTATRPPTPSPTVTATPTALATPLVCVGDCNNDGQVLINEIVASVNIFLETANLSTCQNADQNGDGLVLINEVVAAVNSFLDPTGCMVVGGRTPMILATP